MLYIKDEDENLMCLKAPVGPETNSKTFDALEERLPGLKGRKSYGLSRERAKVFPCILPAPGLSMAMIRKSLNSKWKYFQGENMTGKR